MTPLQRYRLLVAGHWATSLWAIGIWLLVYFNAPDLLLAGIDYFVYALWFVIIPLGPHAFLTLIIWIKEGHWIWLPWRHPRPDDDNEEAS